MNTVKNTSTQKLKLIEVKLSNITFVVECYSHYMANLNNPGWSKNQYTATIKNTGKSIGMMGGRKLIKSQMQIINSRPDLFLN